MKVICINSIQDVVSARIASLDNALRESDGSQVDEILEMLIDYLDEEFSGTDIEECINKLREARYWFGD